MMADTNHSTIPLTIGQRARLFARCLPVLFFALALGAYVTVLRSVYPFKVQLVVFLAVVLAITGYSALQAARDIFSGRAVVTEDLLRTILDRGPHGRGRRHPRGEFERLGRLRLTTAAFHQAQRGRRHRVTYSPASKIVWSVAPLQE